VKWWGLSAATPPQILYSGSLCHLQNSQTCHQLERAEFWSLWHKNHTVGFYFAMALILLLAKRLYLVHSWNYLVSSYQLIRIKKLWTCSFDCVYPIFIYASLYSLRILSTRFNLYYFNACYFFIIWVIYCMLYLKIAHFAT